MNDGSIAIEYLSSDAVQGLPFSEVVRVGNTYYVSGQLGRDASGKLAPGGIAAETRQTMENIKATLARYGLTMDKLISRGVRSRQSNRGCIEDDLASGLSSPPRCSRDLSTMLIQIRDVAG